MKIRTKFFLFLLPVFLLPLFLSFFVFQENKLLFIATEAVVIGSVLLTIRLYREMTEPLRLLLTGLDAIRDQDFNVKFLKTGKYETDKLISVYNKMIDRLRQERTKQEQQHFFLDKLIHTSPTGIIILDYDDRITELNPMARELLELKPGAVLEGNSLKNIDHPVARAAAGLSSGQHCTVNVQGVETYKCLKAEFVDRGFPRPFIMVEELSAEILRAEKNAYGKVIRLMAHEVNNSIGAVNSLLQASVGYADQLQAEDADDFRSALTVCIERNDRLNRFMRNFADIVRLPPPNLELYPLHRLLRNVAQLFQHQAVDRRIELKLDLPEHPLQAMIDVQQMEQVLVNAIRNAMEAIGTEGIIELTLGHHPTVIAIRDNGSGIPPEVGEQLFSPFFTTKKEGQGIGLTLSREILLNHGLGFSLKTKEDGWTEFIITFP